MLGGLVSWVTTGLLRSTARWCSVARCTRRGTPLTDATPQRQRPQRRPCACVALMVAWAPALSMDVLAPRGACGPVVAADASARPQDTPHGHRRARCTWMPCSLNL